MAYAEYRPFKILYQYCSPESFRGIVTSKELWLTDLSLANDPRETEFGKAKFIAAIKAIAGKRGVLDLGAPLDRFSANLLRFTETARAYCACFSLTGDSLPMWNTYGMQCGGLAIGFRPTAIVSMPGRIQLAKYVDPSSVEEYTEAVEVALRDLKSSSTPDDEFFNTIGATTKIFALMTAQKHVSWSYEQEVRLVYAQPSSPPRPGVFPYTSALPDNKLVEWKQPLHRNGAAGAPLTYVSFPFGKYRDSAFDPTGAISEIIMGPKCQIGFDEVGSLLRANGFRRFTVKKSECEIR